MDGYLDRYHLPNLPQAKVNKINRPKTPVEMKESLKDSQPKNVQVINNLVHKPTVSSVKS